MRLREMAAVTILLALAGIAKLSNDTDLKTGKGETLWLHFEGVYQNSQVYINGTLVGTHFYGYTPFKLNISPYIKKGVNTVAVRVDNSRQPNC